MIEYRCDGCGCTLAKHALRYQVTIDVRAAYDELEVGLADLVRSHRDEILALIEKLRHRDPKELEEQIYKKICLDLCPTCQKKFIRGPLQFNPHASSIPGEVDVDAFLRSLGFGTRPDNDPEP